jgi:Secretion system C-terminal sorting domain
MKKILFFLALFCSLSFAQGWNSTVPTSINEPNLDKMDLAANASGIHVLIKRTSGNIVYYYLNSSGVVNSGKTYTMESDGDFPNIVSSNDRVYALYKAGSNIKGKYSTNGGTSWSNLPNITITANLCNGVDAEYQDQQGVHLVWATRDNYPYFETYYYRLDPSNIQWTEFKNVTDYSSAQVGGRPSVLFSSGRVHVSFNTSYYDDPWTPGNAGTRDRLNGSWQTPQQVVSGSEETVREKLLVRGSTLFMFYSKYVSGVPIRNDLVYRTRSVSGTTWSSPTTLATSIEESGNAFNLTKTTNDNIHLVVYPQYVDPNFGLAYISFNGSSWTSPTLLDTDPSYGRNVGFTNISNDLFLTFMRGSDNYLRYKQNNQAPLAPTGLTISAQNYHPRLAWNANAEPDINQYVVEKYVGEDLGWVQLAQTANRYYVDLTESYCSAPPPQQCEAGHMVYYRLKAVDVQSLVSNPSGSVGTYVTGGVPYKIGAEQPINTPNKYSLDQNYPNPFNPTTKISYSIKEEGLVTLKVYDILGKEVTTLVNENKPAGYYEAEFNASALPSGMYIYKIQTGSFSDVKKMLLTK